MSEESKPGCNQESVLKSYRRHVAVEKATDYKSIKGEDSTRYRIPQVTEPSAAPIVEDLTLTIYWISTYTNLWFLCCY